MNAIVSDWNKMLENNTIPLFELEITGGEIVIVNINVDDTRIYFSFDEEHATPRFDGEIDGENGEYNIVYDLEYDTLDGLLQHIFDNMTEGYIWANGLQPEEEEHSDEGYFEQQENPLNY